MLVSGLRMKSRGACDLGLPPLELHEAGSLLDPPRALIPRLHFPLVPSELRRPEPGGRGGWTLSEGGQSAGRSRELKGWPLQQTGVPIARAALRSLWSPSLAWWEGLVSAG